ncbi:hypothetical protein IID22_03020, partial [Patescibacteria group bacterium]|nr:hypothetical protein [Patescibacteria group bacterium]
FIFLLAVAVILPFVGVRAQVVTWLLSAILLKVIFDKTLWNKWRSFLPLFFIFWANLHGGFAAGLLILFFVVAIRSIRKKLIERPDVYVVAASVVATLVNPYGLGAWAEVWRTFTDTALRWQISEWMPAFLTVDLPFAAFVTLSTILVIRYRHKFTLEETGLYFLILLQGVLSKRHIPLWVIVALPMIVSAVNLFYNEIKGIKGSIPRFKKAVKFAFIGSLILLIFQSAFSLRSARVLGEERFYPKGAVSYLEQNLPEGEVFSLYGWGGYLIWKLPEKKVFIDGRMPSWRWDKNPSTESSAAFDDYNNLLKGEKEYKQVFDKYGVDTVLWPRPAPKSVLEVWGDKIESLFAREEKVDFDFLKTIEREGWEKVYEDSVAAIYRKP